MYERTQILRWLLYQGHNFISNIEFLIVRLEHCLSRRSWENQTLQAVLLYDLLCRSSGKLAQEPRPKGEIAGPACAGNKVLNRSDTNLKEIAHDRTPDNSKWSTFLSFFSCIHVCLRECTMRR